MRLHPAVSSACLYETGEGGLAGYTNVEVTRVLMVFKTWKRNEVTKE